MKRNADIGFFCEAIKKESPPMGSFPMGGDFGLGTIFYLFFYPRKSSSVGCRTSEATCKSNS